MQENRENRTTYFIFVLLNVFHACHIVTFGVTLCANFLVRVIPLWYWFCVCYYWACTVRAGRQFCTSVLKLQSWKVERACSFVVFYHPYIIIEENITWCQKSRKYGSYRHPNAMLKLDIDNLVDSWKKFQQHGQLIFDGPLKDKDETVKIFG